MSKKLHCWLWRQHLVFKKKLAIWGYWGEIGKSRHCVHFWNALPTRETRFLNIPLQSSLFSSLYHQNSAEAKFIKKSWPWCWWAGERAGRGPLSKCGEGREAGNHGGRPKWRIQKAPWLAWKPHSEHRYVVRLQTNTQMKLNKKSSLSPLGSGLPLVGWT